MKKVKIATTLKAMSAIESSKLLLEWNFNCAVRPDDAEYVLRMLKEKGHCPIQKTLSDLASVAAALSLIDDFLENLAQASWDGSLLDNLTFDAEGKAEKFDELEVREVEIEDGLADGLLAKARMLKWSAFPEGPDLEWLMNVILEERHNEAHNAVLEYKDAIFAMLRKEGMPID
jgi:hypothetical protein